MPASVSPRGHHAPVKPVDQRLTGLIGATPDRQATVNVTDGDWILPLVARAIDSVMQRKVAALTMHQDAAQLTRQLAADGHLSIRRLGLLGEDFWRAFIDELRAYFALDNDAERLRRALDARAACDRVIEELARKAATR